MDPVARRVVDALPELSAHGGQLHLQRHTVLRGKVWFRQLRFEIPGEIPRRIRCLNRLQHKGHQGHKGKQQARASVIDRTLISNRMVTAKGRDLWDALF